MLVPTAAAAHAFLGEERSPAVVVSSRWKKIWTETELLFTIMARPLRASATTTTLPQHEPHQLVIILCIVVLRV